MDATYGTRNGVPPKKVMLDTLMIRPDPAARIAGSAAWAQTKAASTLTRWTASQSSVV